MITLFTFGPAFGLPDPSPFVTKAEVLLKLSGLPYRTDTTGFGKAPKGKLPYIDDDGVRVADSTFIRWHLEQRHGIDFDQGLDRHQKGVAWAVEKMIEDNLYWTVVDSRWMVPSNFDKGPRRFFQQAPAPIRPVVMHMVKRQIRRTLWGQGLGRHSRAEIERIAKADVDALAGILGDKPWLLGEQPTGGDATAWAFVCSGLCPVFESPIRDHLSGIAALVAYRDRGLARWYPELTR